MLSYNIIIYDYITQPEMIDRIDFD